MHIAPLAQTVLEEHAGQSNTGSNVGISSADEIDVPLALSPMQTTYFRDIFAENSWYNTSIAVKITSPIHPEDLHDSVDSHDSLRSRFSKNNEAR